ncbi:DNA polymerase I [Treponema sp.]|uniref:DNA polymerase I n=1 Tax=Treponema sp. TaxID=166 RepID=UPI003F0F5136
MSEEKEDKTVYILDSYGLIYRAYYALLNHPLTNPAGDNISALVIFFKNLKALISKYNPCYLAAAFDSRVKTFRHEMYAEYKANRAKTPEDLHAQVPWIEEILEALEIPVLRCDGFEADDIIATVAKKCQDEKRPCRILSADKDLLQLVTDSCLEMQPDRANGGWETIGAEEVKSKWGIPPEKILDYLSLVGDASDNIPGVKGVGDKTALKLLLQYESLDGIYEHSSEIKGALGEKIRADRDNAYFSKKLVSLRYDVPVEIDFDSFCTKKMNFKEGAKALVKYGAYAVSKSFASEQQEKISFAEPPVPEKTAVAPRQNSGDYKPCMVLSELENFADSVLASSEKVVAFDTETDSLNTHAANLVGFSLSNERGKGIYVPVILSGGMFAPETISKKDCLAVLEKLFSEKELTLVMHNGKFDLEVLASNGMNKKIECRIFDTMIAGWLLNPDVSGKSPYSLEYMAETRLGLKGIEFKDIVQKNQTFADVPLEQAFLYGAEDADFTLQLYYLLKDEIREARLENLFYEMEMKIIPILASMEIQGIHLDRKKLDEYKNELSVLIREKEKEIYNEAGCEFNISSPKQLQEILFEKRGLPHGKKTKTGYSTDTAVLEELALSTADPIPRKILDYRSYTKLQSTYVEALPLLADKNGRIHTSFLQTGTATGRLSSRDPNLQNIPVREESGRRIRSAFTAVPGTVLISADYAQIELVVLAHLSADENLCSAFINGIDVHKSTAALIYGISPEQVSSEQRRFAKTVNFGVMYGMSAFRLASELNISRTDAKNFIDQYFSTYSGVKKFLDETKSSAREKGYVETITGRRRYIPDIRSANKLVLQGAERIAVNTPIQGSAADIVKTAMIKVQAALEKSGTGAKMLLQVHDELIFECPQENATAAVEVIRREMEDAVHLRIPLRVSIEQGKNWGEFH